jgi:ribosomal protein S17
MKIKKKVVPKYFEKILSGDKTYELRLADFKCGPGDILVLEEWDPKTKKDTGRVIEKTVTYVSKTKGQKFYSKKDVEKYDPSIFQILLIHIVH